MHRPGLPPAVSRFSGLFRLNRNDGMDTGRAPLLIRLTSVGNLPKPSNCELRDPGTAVDARESGPGGKKVYENALDRVISG